MSEVYFSLCTEGRDPATARILTVQYQPLEGSLPQGNLTVLAEWEWSEKEILRSLLNKGFLRRDSLHRLVGFDLQEKVAILVERAESLGLLSRGDREELAANPPPMADLVHLLTSSGWRPGYEHLRDWDKDVAALHGGGSFKAIVDHLHRERDITLDLYRGLQGASETS